MVPICRRGSGEYHVDGDLVFAPKELQYSVFRDAIPLLEVAGGRKTIIVSPIPRYLVVIFRIDKIFFLWALRAMYFPQDPPPPPKESGIWNI